MGNPSMRDQDIWGDDVAWSCNTAGRGHFEDLKLCTSIIKVKAWEEKYQINNDWNIECSYSAPNQLYYVLKVDD